MIRIDIRGIREIRGCRLHCANLEHYVHRDIPLLPPLPSVQIAFVLVPVRAALETDDIAYLTAAFRA
ncbi:MAG TPA: hypothetical protein VMR25_06390 [Planctomycetaceae bacterium]|nr:hypothetical protein [Planctomycetaceae bacterium]